MDSKKLIFPFGFIGVILIIIIYFAGRSYGRKLPPKPVDLSDLNLTPGGYTPSNELSETLIKQIVDDLYNDIKGWTIQSLPFGPGGRNIEVYMTLLRISDVDLMKVMNLWDQKYYSEWNQTLIEAIEKEYFFPYSKLQNEVIARLKFMEQNRK